ncbi:hypothetical protein EJ06DRAFT_577747, partial [Trichodelitschia bisporula]
LFSCFLRLRLVSRACFLFPSPSTNHLSFRRAQHRAAPSCSLVWPRPGLTTSHHARSAVQPCEASKGVLMLHCHSTEQTAEPTTPPHHLSLLPSPLPYKHTAQPAPPPRTPGTSIYAYHPARKQPARPHPHPRKGRQVPKPLTRALPAPLLLHTAPPKPVTQSLVLPLQPYLLRSLILPPHTTTTVVSAPHKPAKCAPQPSSSSSPPSPSLGPLPPPTQA